jgi:hypothetical protein
MSKKSSWVKKRQSESARAKVQQRIRRRKGLFKKAAEFSLECDSDVIVAIRIQQSGQLYIFESSSDAHMLSTLSNLVWSIWLFHFIKLTSLGSILPLSHPGGTGGYHPTWNVFILRPRRRTRVYWGWRVQDIT